MSRFTEGEYEQADNEIADRRKPIGSKYEAMAERIEELEGQLVSEAILRGDDSVWTGYIKRIAELEAESAGHLEANQALLILVKSEGQRIAELKTALRPFAEVGTIISKTATGAFDIPICDYSGKKIWASDCEYARQVLANTEDDAISNPETRPPDEASL